MEKEYVNMCLKLPAEVHKIVWLHQCKLEMQKKRKVSIKEAAISIIKDWGKDNAEITTT